jgi:hypothetical protein
MKNKSISSFIKRANYKILSKKYMLSIIGNDEAMGYYFAFSEGYNYN